MIPPNFLKYRPRPTIKVRDLKEKTVYRVLARVGESQAYGKSTVRYSVQEVNGQQLLGDPFEMYANTSLNILLERQGIPLDVVVIDKKPNEKGEGTIVRFGLPELTRLKI